MQFWTLRNSCFYTRSVIKSQEITQKLHSQSGAITHYQWIPIISHGKVKDRRTFNSYCIQRVFITIRRRSVPSRTNVIKQHELLIPQERASSIIAHKISKDRQSNLRIDQCIVGSISYIGIETS